MLVDKTKIKAIVFDWGGVCCREAEPFASLVLQKSLGLTPEEIAQKVPFYEGYYIGVYNYQTFWRAIIEHFNLTENDEINPEAFSQSYLTSYEFYPEVMNIVRELRLKYKVALLSDLTPEMRDHIKITHQLEDYFDLEVYSCDSDICANKITGKPFKILLKKIGLKAEECLFIDNSSDKIEVAKQLGFSTILFKDFKQFKEDTKFLL